MFSCEYIKIGFTDGGREKYMECLLDVEERGILEDQSSWGGSDDSSWIEDLF